MKSFDLAAELALFEGVATPLEGLAGDAELGDVGAVGDVVGLGEPEHPVTPRAIAQASTPPPIARGLAATSRRKFLIVRA